MYKVDYLLGVAGYTYKLQDSNVTGYYYRCEWFRPDGTSVSNIVEVGSDKQSTIERGRPNLYDPHYFEDLWIVLNILATKSDIYDDIDWWWSQERFYTYKLEHFMEETIDVLYEFCHNKEKFPEGFRLR